ncbi:hypothetical protein [Caulobacter sp. NIBR2454]|uniref:hypothetical protein n=1 Tax=Caulobacter sp. NIBR2454 TaxID=3015996 RepID=UPI0022B71592|nr:hypothetical protein [Caulobacter sp. NIBR2454]
MDDDYRRNPQSAKRWRQRGPAGEAGLNLPVLIRRAAYEFNYYRGCPVDSHPEYLATMRRLKAWWMDNQPHLVDYTPGPLNL